MTTSHNPTVKYISIKIFFLLIVSSLLFVSCEKDYTNDELKTLAIQYSKLKNYNDALPILNQLCTNDSNNPEAYLDRGFIRVKENDYKLACEDFDYASKLGDSIKASYLKRIYCDKTIENFPVQDLEELNLFLEGILKATTGEMKEEKFYWDKVIQLNPKNYEAYYLRGGVSFYYEKNIRSAIKDLDTTISIYTNHSNSFYLKGIIYQEIGQIDSAINNFTLSIKLNPELADAYYYRGVLYIKKRMLDKACADLLKADSMSYQFAAEVIKKYCKL